MSLPHPACTRLVVLSALLTGSLPSSLQAGETAAPPDWLTPASQEKARPCTTCHGLEGQRQGGEMPRIGGRPADELLYELGRFQRADRFQPAMTLLLQSYDVADLAAVAEYFSSRESADLPAY